jgi:parvulin-like peptidyl-prolyl isomerase
MFSFDRPTLRLAIYGAVLAYLVADLLIFNGPLRRTIGGDRPPKPEIAARVAGHPITRSQLDRAVSEKLWLEGNPAADPAVVRAAALEELIDHELLRLKVKELDPPLAASDEEINERLRRLVGRFESKGALETAMKSQGIPNEGDLRDRLAARIRQEKLIALRIGPAIHVTDEEARKWFDANQQSIALPARVEARHIFIPTLDHPPEEAKQKLDAALVELTERKKDFATLAKEISEDPATKDNGGALGWMTRDRLPADFAAPVFSLETNQPALVRTKLGWHLVEITARKPAEPRAFEQAKPEILAALEAIKRRQATEDFRKSLRQAHAAEIEIPSGNLTKASKIAPKREPVDWSTLLIAAALILSPLFAGWALARRQSKS